MARSEREIHFVSGILSWEETNNRDFVWRHDPDPYDVLIAEILLQRTSAEKVEPIYKALVSEYPTPKALSRGDEAEIADLLEPLGLQNRRAAALVKIGQELAERDFPRTEEELMELPFVGRYGANATLCFAFGEDRPVVDANVVRVYERAFGVELDAQSDETWAFAERVLPEDDVQRYNLALLDFAAQVCTSRSPRCEKCFFSSNCKYYKF